MKAEKSDKKEFVMPAKSTVYSESAGQNIFFESGGEFVLPDYMPKVEKLLRTESKVLAPTRYMSGGEAQMSGSILHSLIYIGDEGEVSATVLPSNYEFSVPYGSAQENLNVTALPILESATCRASAPRKITVRSKLRAAPRINCDIDITPKLPADSGLHTLCGEIDSITTKALRMDNIIVSETMEINDSVDARLIWCGANAAVTDLRVNEGGVQVRGDVYVKVLSENGGVAKMHTKKFPFDEFLDGDISRKAMASAHARVISTEASREPSGEALVDVTMCIEATVDMPCKVNAVFDAFSENAELAVEYQNTPCTRLVACRSGVYNVGGSLPKSTLSGFSEMLDTTGDAIVEEITRENGRLTVNGKCMLHSIYHTDDGTYSSAEYSLPFKIALDADGTDSLDTSVNALLASVRTRTDGENLVCDMEIALCVRALEKSECQTVKSVDKSGAKAYKKSEYPLCLIYPNGESLWSLAKKYHVSPERLAKINSLDIGEEEYDSCDALSASKILMLQL